MTPEATAARSVVSVGAVHIDVKARLRTAVRLGSSNPVDAVRTPGGVACNVARTLVRLGVPASLVSVVGDDPVGGELIVRLGDEGIDMSKVMVASGATTASYTAVLDQEGGLVMGIADMAVYDRLDGVMLDAVIAAVGDAGWFTDTNVAPSGLASLARLERLSIDPVSVAKAVRATPALAGATVFPDQAEAEALTGFSDPQQAAASLVARGAAVAVVTCGAGGVVVADAVGVSRRPVIPPQRVVDVTGAGDAFAAGYLAANAHGADDPVGWGLAAASLAVETLDTVPPDLDLPRLLARLG